MYFGRPCLGLSWECFPGLSATMGVALDWFDLSFASEQAVVILIVVYVGAIYGGSRSRILLNIPGTA